VRAYLRIDPNLPDRKADYPDGAYRAYIDTLCFAEQQPQRGRFRNRRLLAVLLDKRARWIKYLIDHGDLVEFTGGKLYVDGWDEWQEGDVTVSERMKRLRSRRRDVTPTDTPGVTPPTVTVPSAVGGSGGGKHLAEAEAARRNNGSPAAFIGMRPRASLEDVRRQEQEQWAKCAECGVPGRKHSSTVDHPFRATTGARA
jgi:hypothetical protein